MTKKKTMYDTIMSARREAFRLIEESIDNFVCNLLCCGSGDVIICRDIHISLDAVRFDESERHCYVNECHIPFIRKHYKDCGLSVRDTAWGCGLIVNA